MKNILITGAARGLGFALASIFYSSGSRLFLVVRREKDLKNLEQEFNGSGILVCDVTKPDYEKELSKLIGDEKLMLLSTMQVPWERGVQLKKQLLISF